jgi:hypothetical protein
MSIAVRAYVGVILPISWEIINKIVDQVCTRVDEGELTPIMFVASEIDNLYHWFILYRQAQAKI